jgi:hypothetical protein
LRIAKIFRPTLTVRIFLTYPSIPSTLHEKVVAMSHKIAYTGILGLVALCVGCTMCCHPYDYNGPVYDCNGQCASNVRAGSILEGADMEAMPPAVNQGNIKETTPNIRQESPNALQGLPNTGDSEGATKILSVTDRKLEPSETLAKSQSSDNETYPSLAQPAPAKRR